MNVATEIRVRSINITANKSARADTYETIEVLTGCTANKIETNEAIPEAGMIILSRIYTKNELIPCRIILLK
jgi:hypothetical protein